MAAILQSMQEIKQWGILHHKEMVWIGIPDYPDLTPIPSANVTALNKMAMDVFKPNFITLLRKENIIISEGDKHRIHYTPYTADLILTQIATFLVTSNWHIHPYISNLLPSLF